MRSLALPLFALAFGAVALPAWASEAVHLDDWQINIPAGFTKIVDSCDAKAG